MTGVLTPSLRQKQLMKINEASNSLKNKVSLEGRSGEEEEGGNKRGSGDAADGFK